MPAPLGIKFLLRNFSPPRHRGTEKSKIILLWGSVTPWCEYLSRLLCFVDPLPAYHRLEHLHISNFGGVDLQDVVAQDNQIGQLAGGDGTFLFLLEFRVGGAHGVGLDGLGDGEFLFGEPAIGIFAVERGAGDGGVDPEHGIERRDIPVGTKRKVDMVVQESAESVSAAGTIVANA